MRLSLRQKTLGAIAFAAVLLASCSADLSRRTSTPATDSACRISRVVDGDTVVMQCGSAAHDKVRLMGFDTPETYKPRCAAEARLGAQATDYLRALVAVQPVTSVAFHGRDRYNRALAQVAIGGRDLAQVMVNEGLAVPYDGGRRIDWCARLQ